jgi:hypothetical protein
MRRTGSAGASARGETTVSHSDWATLALCQLLQRCVRGLAAELELELLAWVRKRR